MSILEEFKNHAGGLKDVGEEMRGRGEAEYVPLDKLIT